MSANIGLESSQFYALYTHMKRIITGSLASGMYTRNTPVNKQTNK